MIAWPRSRIPCFKAPKGLVLARENLAESTVACEIWPWQIVGRRRYAKKEGA